MTRMTNFAAVCSGILLLTLAQAYAQQSIELHASGTTVATGDVLKIIHTLMARAKPSVYLTYRSIGTGGAAQEFVRAAQAVAAGSNPTFQHWGTGGLPLSADDYSKVAGSVTQVPLFIAKASIFHSLPAGSYTGTLNLTACALAKIYTRQITDWGHVDITSTNPGLNITALRLINPSVGSRITVIGRSDVSPSLLALSNYLYASCPSVWNLGVGSQLPVPWPTGTLVMPDTMSILQVLSSLLNATSYTPGAIGCVDSAAGLAGDVRLGEVAISTTPGTWITSSNADNAQVAMALQRGTYPSIDADWSKTAYHTVPGPLGWPMTMVVYAYICKNATFVGRSGGLLLAMMQYLLSDDAQTAIVGNRHVPLLANTRADLSKQLSTMLVVDPASPTWAFESNPTVPLVADGGADYVFSVFRSTYVDAQMSEFKAALADLNTNMAFVKANLSMAQSVRDQLAAATQANAATAAKASKGYEIAIAGVVIAVLIAVVAVSVAGAYVAKTKKLDEKYAKYLPLGVKARFGQDPEQL